MISIRSSNAGWIVPNWLDRKSTRLNSSHLGISYAVFCLKKKKDIVQKAHEILHEAGARTNITTSRETVGIGRHKSGTVKMRNEPPTSVLNSHHQAHQHKN